MSRTIAARPGSPVVVAAAIVALVAACAGGHGGDGGAQGEDVGESAGTGADAGDTDDVPPPSGVFADPDALGPSGLRRLSLAELQTALVDLTGLPASEIQTLLAVLPGDGSTPFDNDETLQAPSAPFVEGMFSLTEAIAARIIDDPDRRDAILGCTPAGADDVACLRTFVEGFGRRALRRPLEVAELDEYAALIEHAIADDDFDVAARMALQALLLDARFLYRVEIGEPVPSRSDLVRLDAYELATRLSFLLWGTGPDDALLDRAAAGELDDAATLAVVATDLLRERRALRQIQRMHALWLGYETLAADPTLAASLRAETDAVLERALADGAWSSAFTADETWLDATTASHYDIPLPSGEPGWVAYPDIRRRGILSHGTLLSLGAKFGDTSPTERGKVVWTRLLCNEIPPPPPQVDTGLPPTGGSADACKTERYDMRTKAECSGCHGILDSVGFGLENYGPLGEWRTTEPDKPECSIAGEGELAEVGAFAGAGALGELLLDSGQLEGCYVRNMLQFAVGHHPTDDDRPLLDALTERFEATDDAAALLLQLATSEGFRHRRFE